MAHYGADLERSARDFGICFLLLGKKKMIVAGYGLQGWLYAAYYWSLGLVLSWQAILGIGLIAALVMGAVWFFWIGWILEKTGRWLGGEGRGEELKRGAIQAKKSMLWMLPFWAIALSINPQTVFILDAGVPSSLLVNGVFLSLGAIAQLKRIEQVRAIQGFSLSRAIANISLTWFISFVLLFFVFCIMRLIYMSI
jgi:hypothetical protein